VKQTGDAAVDASHPPAIQLRRVSDGEFDDFLAAIAEPYAAERAVADGVSLADAQAFVRQQYAALLPVGLKTPGHHFAWIVEPAGNAPIGSAWWFTAGDEAYLYYIRIETPSRRRGFALAALVQIEADARDQGCSRMRLNVFAQNSAALELYRRRGFAPASLHLSKFL
jgi:ribosomal protein S18 acetylase RimI-like enzyme